MAARTRDDIFMALITQNVYGTNGKYFAPL